MYKIYSFALVMGVWILVPHSTSNNTAYCHRSKEAGGPDFPIAQGPLSEFQVDLLRSLGRHGKILDYLHDERVLNHYDEVFDLRNDMNLLIEWWDACYMHPQLEWNCFAECRMEQYDAK